MMDECGVRKFRHASKCGDVSVVGKSQLPLLFNCVIVVCQQNADFVLYDISRLADACLDKI